MKKYFKRDGQRFLCLFLAINIFIVSTIKMAAAPIILVPAAEMLMEVGAAVVGIVSSLVMSGGKKCSSILADLNTELTNAPQEIKCGLSMHYQTVTIAKMSSIPVVKLVASKSVISVLRHKLSNCVSDSSADQKKEHIVSENKNAISINQVNTYIGHVFKKLSVDSADKKLKELFDAASNQRLSSFCVLLPVPKSPFIFENIDYGMAVHFGDSGGYALWQLSDRTAQSCAHMRAIRENNRIAQMNRNLKHNAIYKQARKTEIDQAIKYFMMTQSNDLAESVIACMSLDGIYIDAIPLQRAVAPAVAKLKEIYFQDSYGALCFTRMNYPNKTEKIVDEFMRNITKYSDHVFTRSNLVDPSFYRVNKENSVRCSFKCPSRFSSQSEAAEYNQAVLQCAQACQKFDFSTARAIEQRYKNDALLSALIKQNWEKYTALRNGAALYDKNGIIRIAEKDPAFLINRDRFVRATAQEKVAINENLMMRYWLKQKMHKNWQISATASDAVHDALYTIIGSKGEALADVDLLQKTIEQILKDALREDYADLVKAFYLPNGVLKEYALQMPQVKHLVLPVSINSPTYAVQRAQLNQLICAQITTPEKAAASKVAIDKLQAWLTSTNTKEQIAYKEQFTQAYNAVFNSAVVQANVGDLAKWHDKIPKPEGNDWDHIFKDEQGRKHGFTGGPNDEDPEKWWERMYKSLVKAYEEGKLRDGERFKIIDPQNVNPNFGDLTICGKVVDGIVRIGTAYLEDFGRLR